MDAENAPDLVETFEDSSEDQIVCLVTLPKVENSAELGVRSYRARRRGR
jgi:hypothetical protein